MKKPKLLTKLRVTEVSSVDAGASPGSEIILMKRDDQRSRFQQIFDDAFKKAEIQAADIPSTPSNGVSDRISALADLVVEGAGGSIDRATALAWILHTPKGQSLVLRTAKNHETNKEEPMLIESVVKNYGLISVAKSMAAENSSFGLSEHEFTALISDYAKTNKRAGESDGAAFEREFTSNETLRKAYAVVKNAPLMDLQPTFVSGGDAFDTNPDGSKAMEQLRTMSEELRARSPFLSVSQAFARVFEDPANAGLAAQAHRRPAATTSFAFPR
jgi:hypothetical protein